MHHPLRWLLDVAFTLAWICWQGSRNARLLGVEPRRITPVTPLRVRRPKQGVVAVLVSQAGMEARVRRALGERAALCFTKTWAELQEVLSCTTPLAVFADPLADRTGNPEGHLVRFSREWRIPLILYTCLTPQAARVLLNLGPSGISHVLFHRFDDGDERLNAVVDWARYTPRNEPPLRAA